MYWPLMNNAITKEDVLDLIHFISGTDKYTSGEKVIEFEKKWNDWLGSKYSLFVSSGSTANFLLISSIIERYNLKPKDKVLVPSCTWATTVGPIVQLGLEPVFCDINYYDFSFDISHMEDIKEKNNDIKVVFVTHLLGIPANIEKYKEIFPNSIFIEDSCESHGATINGNKVGNFSSGSTFSFYYGHHMTTIEGGMVSCSDKELYEIMKMKRSHGMAREASKDTFESYQDKYPDIDKKFLFATDGYNFRNTEIAAVLGISQLKRLDENIKKRVDNFNLFVKMLNENKDLFEIPKTKGNSSFCLPFIVKDLKLKEKLMVEMNKNGIETRPIMAGNLLEQPFLKNFSLNKENANVEYIHSNGFYIGNNHIIGSTELEFLSNIIDQNVR